MWDDSVIWAGSCMQESTTPFLMWQNSVQKSLVDVPHYTVITAL
jgi:hypothetical protein